MSTANSSALLDMDKVRIDPSWALRVPSTLALRRSVLPFTMVDGKVHVACIDDQDEATLQAVQRVFDLARGVRRSLGSL
jgi:type IV pilus assembly protein PilB